MGENPVFVVFLDCLDPDELNQAPYLSSIAKGKIESGIPRVTPQVITGINTGVEPPEHGVLCPTRLDKDNLTRPRKETLIEEFSQNYRVLNYELPFSLNLQGRFLTNIGSAPQIRQQNKPDVLNIPPSSGSLWKDDPEKCLQSHIDYVRGLFSTIRNLARQGLFDIIFLTVRNIDSFGHFYFKEERQKLINYIDLEVGEIAKMGDSPIIAFSDHGITEKKRTFYINQWLKEQGWLSVDFWEKGWKETKDNDLKQVSIHSPFIDIKEDSYFASPDAYDSGIKILKDDAPVEELIKKLKDTKFYKGIHRPKKLYGDGPYLNNLGVDLVLDREDGILVSGNLHPEIDSSNSDKLKCQGKLRTGVHSRHGFWGSNLGKEKGQFKPTEFHDQLKKFIKNNAKKPDNESLFGYSTERNNTNRLENLGYL